MPTPTPEPDALKAPFSAFNAVKAPFSALRPAGRC
jgi:hypothetical protein